MAFWLDDPSRRSTYRREEALEPSGPAPGPEAQAEPVLIHAAPPKRIRGSRRPHLIVALAGAAGLHGGLALLLVWSASKARLDVEPAADTAALFASLTTASALSAQPTAEPPSPPRAVQTVAEAPESTSPTLAAAPHGPSAETKTAPAIQSADVEEALLNTSRSASADISPVHEDTDNPWAHASVRAPGPSTGEKLWAAIKPCLHDSLQGRSSIRVVLDDGGRVQRMTDVDGGEAQADPELKVLAGAAAACAPYDRVITGAGSYLIVTPG